MQLYHGTSRLAWEHIKKEGVQAPSYWGTEAQAREYADSFGENGVILSAQLDEDNLQASLLMAQALIDEGDLDAMPDDNDLEYSLEYLGGVTCTSTVRHAELHHRAIDHGRKMRP